MFEFTMELAWNTLKDVQFYEGFDTKTPREAIRRGFDIGLLTEEEAETLLDALNKRNVLSHSYEAKMAAEAEQIIKRTFAPMIRALYDRLEERKQRL